MVSGAGTGRLDLIFDMDRPHDISTRPTYGFSLVYFAPAFSSNPSYQSGGRDRLAGSHETITHPVVVVRGNKKELTRIKKDFGKKGDNILGLTIPFTNSYYINGAAKDLGRYPTKSVDVHEIAHNVIEDEMPGIARNEHFNEIVTRDFTDMIEGTDSADKYEKDLTDNSYHLAVMYGRHPEEIRRGIKDMRARSKSLTKELLKEPIQMYIPTSIEEEEKLRRGELAPHVNTLNEKPAITPMQEPKKEQSSGYERSPYII